MNLELRITKLESITMRKMEPAIKERPLTERLQKYSHLFHDTYPPAPPGSNLKEMLVHYAPVMWGEV